MVFSPQMLEELATRSALGRFRVLAEEMEQQVLLPLWSASTADDLDLREESATAACWRITAETLSIVTHGNADLPAIATEMADRCRALIPGATRRIAGTDAGIYAARTFMRTWAILSDFVEGIMPVVLAEVVETPLPSELPEDAWADPVFRDLQIGQTYLLALLAATEREGAMPAMTGSMCARAYRSTTTLLRLISLVDPSESRMTRPRYRPLRHDTYRASETAALERRLRADDAPDLLAILGAAMKRVPIID